MSKKRMIFVSLHRALQEEDNENKSHDCTNLDYEVAALATGTAAKVLALRLGYTEEQAVEYMRLAYREMVANDSPQPGRVNYGI